MKIISLHIKNLASLEGNCSIDFTQEPLASAGIFAITGPTGSGKSTLLDALCLGLYGKTPRYLQAGEAGVEVEDVKGGDKIKQNDVRAILRDGTADGFSEVVFIGVDGHQYAATWSVRRARNRIDGSLQQVETKLFNRTTNTPLGGKKNETLAEIERVVGLNFEQFTRSVLLAQGDFTAFLKADKDAKASLLEKLTGTDIYSAISIQIFEKHKEAKDALKLLEAQKEGITLLSDDSLDNLLQQQLEVEHSILANNQSQLAATTGIAWYERSQSLEMAMHAAAQQLATAEANKQNAAPQIAQLATVESMQPAHTLLDACTNSEQLLHQKKEEAANWAEKTALANLNYQSATQQYQLAESEAAQAANAWKNAQPDLSKAKELDALIAEKSTQHATAQQEMEQTNAAFNTIVLRVREGEQQLTNLQEEADKVAVWKQQNVARQPIAENIVRITTELTHAASRLGQLEQIAKEMNAKTTLAETVHQQTIQLSHQLQEGKLSLESKRAAIELLQNELQPFPLETRLQEEAALMPAIEATVAAKAQWEKLYAIEQEVVTIKQNQSILQQSLQEKNGQLVLLTVQLQVVTIKKEQTNALLTQVQLQANENVEHLRSQLTDGNPCPVCGSEHHPLVGAEAQPRQTLLLLENAYQDCVKTYEQLLKESAGLSEQVRQLQVDMDKSERELIQKNELLATNTDQWNTLPLSFEIKQITADERLFWLETQLTSHRKNLIAVQQQLAQYREKSKALQQLKDNLVQMEKQATIIDNELKDKLRLKATYSDQIASLQTQEADFTKELTATIDNLTPFFNKPTWVDSWKKAAQPFVDKLNQFATEWEQERKSEEELAVKQQLISTQLASWHEQHTSLEKEKQAKAQKLSVIAAEMVTKRSQRSLLFEGMPLDVVAAKFSATLEQTNAATAKLLQTKQQMMENWLACKAAEEQLQKDIAHFTTTLQQQQLVMSNWLDTYYNTHHAQETIDTLRQHLSLSQDWIAAQKQAVATIHEAITSANALLNERTTQFSNHQNNQIPSLSEADLRQQLSTAQQYADVQNALKAEIDFALKTDLANKQKVGSLMGQISKQTTIEENWAKLNDIVGSADGKKFRQIAQEYTLDILLGYANNHLQNLSTRYMLMRIPNSLGLQVIDTDMGDEVRTVFSLSGGESFLVSLALALGLASLSSNKMKVESLFIDEGFGTLDPLTLQIAMDALETLRNQGRKVGVISHVQEMTDRIATQIRVVKLSNGKSKVEVVNV